MEDMEDIKPSPALTLSVVLGEVKPLEHFTETLGLRNEGLDPCDQSFEEVVSRKEVEKVFPRKQKKGYFGYPIKGAVDADGKPDPGMVAFAEEMLQKVYNTNNREWRRNPGLAFARGVIADRRGVAVNWAAFAHACQIKPMKAAPSPSRRALKRGSSAGMEEKDEKSFQDETPASDGSVRRGFMELLEDANEGILAVRREGTVKTGRVESVEEQIRRAEVRKRAAEEEMKDLRSSVDGLEAKVQVELSKGEDEALSLAEAKRKAEALRAEWFSVTASVERNLEQKTRLQDSIQDLFEEKKRLASSGNSWNRARKEQMLNAELEYAQQQLAFNLSEGGLLQKKLASQEQIEVAIRQMIEASESSLRAATESCAEIRERLLEKGRTLRDTKATSDRVASVYNLYKASNKLTISPRSIAQPNNPEECSSTQLPQVAKPCPVCSRWFFCNDYVGASCGCHYHLHCAALWFQGSQKNCCKVDCGKRMHPDWLTAWGKDWDPVDELINQELGMDERRKKWKQEACGASNLQETDSVQSPSQDSAVDNSPDDSLQLAKRQRKDEDPPVGHTSPASVLKEADVSEERILPVATRQCTE